jgi:hypothetical protein
LERSEDQSKLLDLREEEESLAKPQRRKEESLSRAVEEEVRPPMNEINTDGTS